MLWSASSSARQRTLPMEEDSRLMFPPVRRERWRRRGPRTPFSRPLNQPESRKSRLVPAACSRVRDWSERLVGAGVRANRFRSYDRPVPGRGPTACTNAPVGRAFIRPARERRADSLSLGRSLEKQIPENMSPFSLDERAARSSSVDQAAVYDPLLFLFRLHSRTRVSLGRILVRTNDRARLARTCRDREERVLHTGCLLSLATRSLSRLPPVTGGRDGTRDRQDTSPPGTVATSRKTTTTHDRRPQGQPEHRAQRATAINKRCHGVCADNAMPRRTREARERQGERLSV